ncbi:hypothetical protein OUZ56_021679 [Daphnia magna]|uniref:Uncharacterized protein n=1 Tax=Daphnia magna TaxID=35525 RepID=A0ABR0AUD5_9CRUS|nr:hypothetical protein OUZ56_021679 [Daphnia magna]
MLNPSILPLALFLPLSTDSMTELLPFPHPTSIFIDIPIPYRNQQHAKLVFCTRSVLSCLMSLPGQNLAAWFKLVALMLQRKMSMVLAKLTDYVFFTAESEPMDVHSSLKDYSGFLSTVCVRAAAASISCNPLVSASLISCLWGVSVVELQENQVETFEGYPVPKDCVSQSIKVKYGTE